MNLVKKGVVAVSILLLAACAQDNDKKDKKKPGGPEGTLFELVTAASIDDPDSEFGLWESDSESVNDGSVSGIIVSRLRLSVDEFDSSKGTFEYALKCSDDDGSVVHVQASSEVEYRNSRVYILSSDSHSITRDNKACTVSINQSSVGILPFVNNGEMIFEGESFKKIAN